MGKYNDIIIYFALIAITILVLVVLPSYQSIRQDKGSVLGSVPVGWKGAGATSTRVGITTTSSTVMSQNPRRSSGEFCNDTFTARISCEYGRGAVAGEGKVLSSSTEMCIRFGAERPWFGELSCVSDVAASGTLSEF